MVHRALVLIATLLLVHQRGLAQQPTLPPESMPPGGAPLDGMLPGGRPDGVYGMPKANTAGIMNKFLNVAYATTSPAQQLDIYLPNTGNGPFPMVVAIHGGAFKMGDKGENQVNPMLEGVKRGYAVVSVNYRLSGEAPFPAQIQDVKAAIRFLRAHAKKYQLNPDKIATWGGSAGGYLSAMVGTTGDMTEFDDPTLGNAKESSRVQAVVNWYGPVRFDQMDAQFLASGKGQPNHNDATSPESELLGQALPQVPALVRRASPATYLSKNDPPFYLAHGTADPMVPTEQSTIFYAELVKVLGPDKVTLTLLDGAGHGGPQFETSKNIDKVFFFLDKYLK